MANMIDKHIVHICVALGDCVFVWWCVAVCGVCGVLQIQIMQLCEGVPVPAHCALQIQISPSQRWIGGRNRSNSLRFTVSGDILMALFMSHKCILG